MASIYLAASFDLQRTIRQRKRDLQGLGFEVTSRWVEQEARPVDTEWKLWGIRDFDDLKAADIIVIDQTVPSTSGGMHVELGLALAWGKRILFIGTRKTVFHYLDEVEVYPDWESCRCVLQDLIHEKPRSD